MRKVLHNQSKWNSAEMCWVYESVGYTMIGGGVTLYYPAGETHAPLWLQDGSRICHVEVSPYRFAQLMVGGALRMERQFDGDRGVEKTRWNYIYYPDTHKQDHSDGLLISVVSIAYLAKVRMRIGA